MKTIALIAAIGLLLLLQVTDVSHAGAVPEGSQPQSDYAHLKADAERAYGQGSYARANEIYSHIDKTKIPEAEQRWVNFRIADTSWRAQSATNTADNTKYELAQKQLEELIRVVDKEDERDWIWVESHESLGDFFWIRPNQMNWGTAWPHYQLALDWWAGQRDIEPARARYLQIIFKASQPPQNNEYYFYTYYGNYIPLNILENALKISTTEKDKVYLHYLIAMTMRYSSGDYESRQRVPEEFELALKAGKQSDWYDDALYYYAEWMANNGNIVQLDESQWQQEPDYVQALELFRRLIREFKKGESRYFEQAQQQIKNITEPALGIGVSNIFLPDSELQFSLNARNVRSTTFSIYKIDLTRDPRFTKNPDEEEGEGDTEPWLQRVPVAGLTPVKTWTKAIDSKVDHKPVSEEVRIEGKLPVGAYLLEAKSGLLTARDLVLITDVSVAVKASGKEAVVYFCNAITGAPVANASVAIWEGYTFKDKWRSRKLRGTTNSDGLASFQLTRTSYHTLYAAAALGDRQSFSYGNGNGNDGEGQSWRIYAFTDRPAYRPKETVQWKFLARRMTNGVYTTPASQVVEYEIIDPKGVKIKEASATLNSFGSAWSSLELTEQLPLGEYHVQFWDQGKQHSIGNATLFRLEEYKLPEFKVAVKTPEEDGKKKAFRLGEKVEVDIQADYYFGGPVSNASVEVVVYQNTFYHYWYPHRDYPWYYDEMNQRGRYNYGGQGQVVKRETIKTDATGKATLSFDTPRENYNQDFEYRIEARVTDSSRREIVSSDTVRVTRQRYYVYPRPERNIYRPKDKVTVDFKALDANEQPVTTEGTVKVTREYWWEVWIDPTGREVKGQELRALRDKQFPPVVGRGQKPWRLKFRGYQHDDILTQNLKTDAEGNAKLEFATDREGYYKIAWSSSQANASTAKRNRFLPLVKAETYVFVATNASTDLGYRHDGVEIIVDKDTFRSGQTAPVMLVVDQPDRYVLFSVESEDIFSYKLVHITGTTKLIELPITEKYVPNVYLNALMISDTEAHLDNKEVVVPPVQQFLTVDVKADREQYQPHDEGTFSITTRDVDGKPISAEVGLGLFDESVKYIQQDYAGDPRQFYFGTKRSQTVQTQTTFSQKTYAKLIEGINGQLRDRKEIGANEEDDVERELPKNGPKDNNFRLDGGDFASEYGRASGAMMPMAQSVVVGGMSNRVSGQPSDSLRKMKSADAAERPVTANEPPPPPNPQQEPAVQVRSDFRSTIFWQPDIVTDADGKATIKVTYPDSLTSWVATARVASSANQFGIGNATTRTKQPLIVRLQSPRFFVVGDQVTVSAVINNNTDQPMTIRPALKAEGLTVGGLIVDGKITKGEQGPVLVKANDETRIDWVVTATTANEAKLKVEARGDKYSDAMEKTYLVYEHG
ncbi:MAG TPA: alpha-2-macroglobulin family protein, partial [Pyrinomonadaceae bacterium]|nr:alpha-2-macroglobulin family protein [Pyrinomonadaceae bacterium]